MKRIEYIIVSSGREANVITAKIMPFAKIVVKEKEYEKYKKNYPNAVVEKIDNGCKGLGRTRQAVLEKNRNNIIVFIDDDIECLYYYKYDKSVKVVEPEIIKEIIDSNIICANDAGIGAVAFCQTSNPKYYSSYRPIALVCLLGGLFCILDTSIDFEPWITRGDYDYTLQHLLKNRIVWQNTLYAIKNKKYDNQGGVAEYRTSEIEKKEIDLINERWGHYLLWRRQKNNNLRMQLKIQR